MRRWTATDEIAAAEEIRAAERRTLEALEGIPSAAAILARRPSSVERTRVGAVRRLEAAVQAALEGAAMGGAPGDPPGPEIQAAAAWQEVVTACWALAMSARAVARAEARKLSSRLVGEDDLIQEGYIGLLKAARRYEPDRGIRFSTYARWWARAQMTRAIEQTGRLVRLPGGAVEQLRYLHQAAEDQTSRGLDRDTGTLAAVTGIGPRRALQLLSLPGVVFLDQPDEDGARIEDRLLFDSDAVSVDERIWRGQTLRRVQAAITEVLSERERLVIQQHFGLAGAEPRAMSEIGRSLRLSRERVRQIQGGALVRLRSAL